MNIVIITPGFSADEDDLGIPCLTSLVKRLAIRHRVTVIPLEYPARGEGYLLRDIPVLPVGATRFAPTLYRVLRILKRLNREHRIDVIHAFFAGRCGAVAAIIARLMNRPLVMTVMGGELVRDDELDYGGARSPVTRCWSLLAMCRANTLICLSQYAARVIPPRFHPKMRILPFGIDPAVFFPGEDRPVGERPLRLLSVGSLVPIKGHSVLLSALARMPSRNRLELHVVGSGPLESELKTQAARLGIAAMVQFHGQIPHASLPQIYRSADALVVSSKHETQSMVAIEAAISGCVVAGTAVGVLPEILPDNLLAVPGDVDSLACVLEAMVRSAELGDTEQLRLSALERFNLSAQATALERCYEAAIAVHS